MIGFGEINKEYEVFVETFSTLNFNDEGEFVPIFYGDTFNLRICAKLKSEGLRIKEGNGSISNPYVLEVAE